MKEEVESWLRYARENLESARVLLAAELFNPCLQNLQQGIEKYLKAVLLQRADILIKTHSITSLRHLLAENGVDIDLSEDECALFDSIYLPSKYPLAGVLPDFVADAGLCQECLRLAEIVALDVEQELGKQST